MQLGLSGAEVAYERGVQERRAVNVPEGISPGYTHRTMTGRTSWHCDRGPFGGGVAAINIRRSWKAMGVVGFAEPGGVAVITAGVDDDGEVVVCIPDTSLVHVGHVEALNVCIMKLGVQLVWQSPAADSYLDRLDEDVDESAETESPEAQPVAQVIVLPGDVMLRVTAPEDPSADLIVAPADPGFVEYVWDDIPFDTTPKAATGETPQ